MTLDASQNFELNQSQWFEYHVKAHPHHTDYAGIVWHGSYVSWMEEARVEYLRSLGVEFSDFVAAGCDLPVVDLQIRYHREIRHGKPAVIKARMTRPQGVRIKWDYRIESPNGEELYTTAQVTLVPIDRSNGRIMRRLPDFLENALACLAISGVTP
jgi:acyl-CoA thioester hydrolase